MLADPREAGCIRRGRSSRSYLRPQPLATTAIPKSRRTRTRRMCHRKTLSYGPAGSGMPKHAACENTALEIRVPEVVQIGRMDHRSISKSGWRPSTHLECSGSGTAKDRDEPIHAAVELEQESFGMSIFCTQRETVAARDIPHARAAEFPFQRIIVVEGDNYIAGLNDLRGELCICRCGLRVNFPEPLPQTTSTQTT